MNFFKDVPSKILQKLQELFQVKSEEDYNNGVLFGLEQTISIMFELDIDEKKMKELIIKYFNLRPSKAEECINLVKSEYDKINL